MHHTVWSITYGTLINDLGINNLTDSNVLRIWRPKIAYRFQQSYFGLTTACHCLASKAEVIWFQTLEIFIQKHSKNQIPETACNRPDDCRRNNQGPFSLTGIASYRRSPSVKVFSGKPSPAKYLVSGIDQIDPGLVILSLGYMATHML